MELYDLIADNYETIFPIESEKIDFIKKLCPPSARIFDAGCATGGLAIRLCKEGYSVLGVDLNNKMIELAKKAAAQNLGTNADINFKTAGITDITEFGTFNAVLCFGNTLPHLPNEHIVSAFFHSVQKSLSDRGLFLFQILNYDKILSDKKIDFRVMETAAFIFKRHYEFLLGGKIKFIIEFTDKKRNKTHLGSTILLPLIQQPLCALLHKAGFKSVRAYSDYGLTKSNLQEYSAVYVAKK